jgi:hypothetical protein
MSALGYSLQAPAVSPEHAFRLIGGSFRCNQALADGGFARRSMPMNTPSTLPTALDPTLVGTYPASAKAGGGYVWDAVLEYRVWCYPRDGAEDVDDGSDYYYAFASHEEAQECAAQTAGAQEPLALVLQQEYIDEPESGRYVHMREHRVTEWPVEFLSRPRRTPSTIPDFMSPTAPANRLEILRGTAS